MGPIFEILNRNYPRGQNLGRSSLSFCIFKLRRWDLFKGNGWSGDEVDAKILIYGSYYPLKSYLEYILF